MSTVAPPTWEQFRAQMPVAQRYAYFDHAAVAPLSQPAASALVGYAEQLANSGAKLWSQWELGAEATRQTAARLIGAQIDEIALVGNTTHGIGLVAEGFPWRPGDNVVVPPYEFPSNLYPWLNLQSRGVETRRVPVSSEALDVNALAAACDQRTRLIAVSWVGYATGWRNHLEQIAALAHDRGIALLVDAIQGLGVLPLQVDQLGIDFLAADGHKWMLGPEGAGLLYIRHGRLEELRPLNVGWHSVRHAGDFTRTDLDLKPAASRYEGGSQNLAGCLALGASLRLLETYGIDRISERLLEYTDRLCDRLTRIGARIVSRRGDGHSSGIVACELPGRDPAQLRRHCATRDVIVNHRAGRLRLSPHVYQNDDDLDRLIDALVTATR